MVSNSTAAALPSSDDQLLLQQSLRGGIHDLVLLPGMAQHGHGFCWQYRKGSVAGCTGVVCIPLDSQQRKGPNPLLADARSPCQA